MHRLSWSRWSWLAAEHGVPQWLARSVELGRARLAARAALPPGERALAAARSTFLACIADIHGTRSAELEHRVRAALGLRELWHLRSDTFALVSHALDQSTAQARLALIARHFPTRSPGSGFAPLGPGTRA